MRCSDWQYIQKAGWWKCVCNSFFALKVILSVQLDGKASCASIWGKELKSGLIGFIVTFFIFGYKHQVIAEPWCMLDIDRSADLGIENSPSQWNKRKTTYQNSPDEKIIRSKWAAMCAQASVNVLLWEERFNPPPASQSRCKQTHTQAPSSALCFSFYFPNTHM